MVGRRSRKHGCDVCGMIYKHWLGCPEADPEEAAETRQDQERRKASIR